MPERKQIVDRSSRNAKHTGGFVEAEQAICRGGWVCLPLDK
jgi:hypothetical protein